MSDQQPPVVPGRDEQPPYGSPSPYGSSPYGSSPYGPPAAAPPAYVGGYAGAAVYGVDPVTGASWSDKTRTTAGLLSMLLPLVGFCGVGRLYTGHVGLGLAQLLGFFVACALMVVLIGFVLAPAVWLWSVVDGIVLLANGGTDRYGRRLR